MANATRIVKIMTGVLALLATGLLNAQALPTLDISQHNVIPLAEIAEFMVSDGVLPLDDVQRADFRTLQLADIARGLTDQVHWLRFSIKNSARQPTHWVLHGDSSYLDVMHVYFHDRSSSNASSALSGFDSRLLTDLLPFSSRMLDYRKLAFSHSTPVGASTDIYMAVSYAQADAMRLDFTVYERAYFDDRGRIEYLLFGAWYGVLLLVLMGSLLVAVVMRQRSAGYYAAFIASTALMWTLLNGLGVQYVWPNNVYLQNQGFHLSYLLFAFCAFQFSRHFLRLSVILPRLNRLMLLTQMVIAATAILRLLGNHELVLILSYLALASTMLLPLVGVLAWQRGMRHARWFSLAWLIYSLTLTLAVLNAATMFPGWSMDKTLAFVQAGIIVEVLLLVIAIGERFLQLESERRAALDLAHRDPLTGLGNRRRLVESYQHLAERFEKTGAPVFLGLIDLDEFKAINDRYGHDAGDAILCQLADILQQHSRGDDTCIRYGGDEFVLLVQAENAQAVELIVERIRTRFSERPTVFDGQFIRHTLSAGVITAFDQGVRLSPAEMLMKVDMALYEAKNGGRNRTIVRA